MNRSLTLTLGTAAILALAACTPAAGQSTWTYAPADAANASAVPAQTADAATPEPTAVPEALGTTDAPRVVTVTMGNFFFEPASTTVRAGETIRFVLGNPTTIPHEMVLGDAAEQEHHAQEMAAGMDQPAMGSMAPGMPIAEPNEVEVQPGETAELVWTFDQAGEQFMACHIAGHREAGMESAIEVAS